MILRLLIANALELAVGVGIVSALRLPLGTAYLAGLAVVGIVSAHLALVRVEVGWTLLVVFAGVSLLAAYLRRPDTLPRVGRGSGGAFRRPGFDGLRWSGDHAGVRESREESCARWLLAI